MDIKKVLEKQILVIDGAMGTMIQRYKLEENDYRGNRFADWKSDLKEYRVATTYSYKF